MRIVTLILNALSWRTVRDNGVWIYQQNSRTGARRAIRHAGAGHQPVDAGWLQGGEIIG